MVLSRLSEAGGRGAGGFFGGIANNPGIIIIAVAIAALFLFRGRISEAFGSLAESVGNIGNVELPDITLPSITFPQITFPEFPQITLPESPFTADFFSNLFGFLRPENGLAPPAPGPVAPDESGGFGGLIIPEGCTVDDQGIIRCPTPPTFDVCKTIPGLCEPGETTVIEPPPGGPGVSVTDEIKLIVKRGTDMITNLLPGSTQTFGFGGPSFEGGFIFENPIDTFSEVLAAFPQLTASQAADFLAQFSGILPSQLPGIDPDIRNIVANVEGENIQVPTTTPGALETEAIKAACTSCELFNLNCEQCRGGGFA